MNQVNLQNVEQVLNEIKRRQTSYASSVWIPSINKEIRFLEINTGQQKKLVKSIIDSPVFNTEFICTFRDVLKENCVDEINIDTFNIIDKLFIAINLRASSIGPMIPVEVKNMQGETVKINIDLNEIYKKAKEKIVELKPVVVSNNVFNVTCCLPTIGVEYALEREMRSEGKNIDTEDINEVKEAIGTAFIEEVVKYVGNVTLREKEGETDIGWNALNYSDRLRIVARFDSNLLKQIITYINTAKEAINNVEIFNFKFKDEIFTERLVLDENFFMLS
jgi:hypothetical protein